MFSTNVFNVFNFQTMELLLDDEYFMKQALKEAVEAFNKEEVPVGAIIVCDNKIIGRGHNLTERLNDVTAHAEMQAITAAANYLGGKYLSGCILYVTVEPCIMCAGAAFWSQLGKIIYGTRDEKKGYLAYNTTVLHPKTIVKGGVLEDDCAALMKNFFKKKR